MGIDRISKGPPHVPAQGPAQGGGDPVAPSAKPREFHRTTAKTVDEVPRANPGPLARFRAGELDFDGYLDAKVEQATAHLQGLDPDQLQAVRHLLRTQLVTDPGLADLVRQATGVAPKPPSEEP